MTQTCVRIAERLMAEFASRTLGPMSGASGVRYLWTDAFAVFNYLALEEITGNTEFLSHALELVDQVHRILGRHRDDDSRRGWISGLGELDGQMRPTRGGLRIGKRMPERGLNEPDDEDEWERDGQYFHYLTKWMHALNRMTLSTGDTVYNDWAIELAQSAHRAFVYSCADGRRRMHWKMSIDLSRPLVASMGQHDPLDGFVACCQLMATRAACGGDVSELISARADFRRMCDDRITSTRDELGMGGLLMDAAQLVRLTAANKLDDSPLIDKVLRAANLSLPHFAASRRLNSLAGMRLAFRELGLAIGLQAIPPMRDAIVRHADRFDDSHALLEQISAIERYMPLVDGIQHFWLQPENQAAVSWRDHSLINCVMLATCLVPHVVLLCDGASFKAVEFSRPEQA
jgi:hypothetical protein